MIKSKLLNIGNIDEYTKIIISFDGGGIRGIVSSLIAEALEKSAGVPLFKACDLMVGTSVGGIISLLLNTPSEGNNDLCRYSASDIAYHFEEYGEKIFSRPSLRSIKGLFGLNRAKYSNDILKEMLEKQFGTLHLNQSLSRVLLIGANIEKYKPILFKSYDEPNFFMKDIALATSSAPSFFPISRINQIHKSPFDTQDDGLYIIDGGIAGLNNPSLLAYSEICDIFSNVENIKEKILLISIGTGKAHRTIHFDEVSDGGTLAWLPFFMPLIFELPNDIIDYQLGILLKDKIINNTTVRHYWRFQPSIPEEYLTFGSTNLTKIKDMKNIVLDFLHNHDREIIELGQILLKRSEYIAAEKAKTY